MTGPEDSHSDTRPISVAELLARNGTIGAPPVGGRRRRRRGNTDSVTVAELTGEIPIIRQDQVEALKATADSDVDEGEYVDATEAVFTNGLAEHVEERQAVKPVEEFVDEHQPEPETGRDAFEYADVVDEGAAVDEDERDDDYADAVADYAAHIEHRDADPDPVDFFAPTRRPHFGGAKPRFQSRSDAEQMSPDPVEEDVDDEDLIDSSVDLVKPLGHDDADATAVIEMEDDDDEVPSYLRSTQGPLFGGQTVADDIARRGFPSAADHDLHEESDTAAPSATSSFLRGTWIVAQCIIAVAFGAGLFIAFDQLWKWNNIVALVLSVLVILGLVVGVRVVRKTEDIGSTLIAVAVGALVTLGPLALLQSG
jgi:hypothetical protein